MSQAQAGGDAAAAAPPAADIGRVVAAHGRHALVRTALGQRLRCHPRGKKAEVVVGDLVRWAAAGDEGVIEAVLPRRNLLHRQDAWKTKSFAANLDQILILLAAEPPWSEAQLGRALIAAAHAGIAAFVVLNKIDLPSAEAARARLAPYRAMGVELLQLALRSPDAAEREASRALLQARLQGRVTFVLGPSGMGKSSLINALVPEAQAQVGEVSRALNTGRHTTTATTWYPLAAPDTPPALAEAAGAVIDSPGFQAFGLHHIAPEALAGLMPDLAAAIAAAGGCRFHNCRHRDEPGCAVSAAVAAGAVAPQRQALHRDLCDELATPHWQRAVP